MRMHYDMDIDLDQVVDLFAKMHPQKLEMQFVKHNKHYVELIL